MIVLDSSFLVSFYHPGDSNHAKAIQMARENRGTEQLVSDVIVFETLTILGIKADKDCAKNAYEELVLNKNIRILYFSDEERKEIIQKFLSQNEGLSAADISVIHLAEKTGANVLAFDRKLLRNAKK